MDTREVLFTEPAGFTGVKRQPDISPLQSPVIGGRKSAPPSRGGIFDDAQPPTRDYLPKAVAASFLVKHKKGKSWLVVTNMDCGTAVHDEARFRDCSKEVSWADLEVLSKKVDVSLPPGIHLLLPALRAPLIRKWLEVVVSLRGLDPVLDVVGANDFSQRCSLSHIFSRSFHSAEVPESSALSLGQ